MRESIELADGRKVALIGIGLIKICGFWISTFLARQRSRHLLRDIRPDGVCCCRSDKSRIQTD
jgi:hypothetical protein